DAFHLVEARRSRHQLGRAIEHIIEQQAVWWGELVHFVGYALAGRYVAQRRIDSTEQSFLDTLVRHELDELPGCIGVLGRLQDWEAVDAEFRKLVRVAGPIDDII